MRACKTFIGEEWWRNKEEEELFEAMGLANANFATD